MEALCFVSGFRKDGKRKRGCEIIRPSKKRGFYSKKVETPRRAYEKMFFPMAGWKGIPVLIDSALLKSYNKIMSRFRIEREPEKKEKE